MADVIYCLKAEINGENKVYCILADRFVELKACRSCRRYCYELMDMVICKWNLN